MRQKNGTTQHSVDEQIGELFLTANAKVSREEFAVAVAKDFAVKVEYSHKPGDDGPGEVTISAILAGSTVHFDGEGVCFTVERGHDIKTLFAHYQLDALEDKLLAMHAKQPD